MILDFFRLVNESVISRSSRAVGHGYTYGDSTRQKFTGYERDEETNLDFAQARMYSNQLGRFTTVDPLLSSGKPFLPQTWNRFAYAINNPLRFVDPTGLCSAPTGLKKGQVGICFEAFIAAPKLGTGGIGHGDGRGHNGNNEQLTARVTVWTIISTDTEKVYKSKTEEVSPSVIGVDLKLTDGSTINLPDGSTYRVDPSVGGSVSLQGTATTDVQLSNINSKKGEKDFGAGVDVTVSIANGTNGGQQLGKDLQNSSNPLKIAAGKAIEAASPGGTIDGSATLRITGRGNVSFVAGETRQFPSYAVYAYTVGADGKPQIVYQRTRDETPPVENLTKPKTPW